MYIKRKETEKMTKAEFITLVADKSGLSKKDAGVAVDAFTDSLTELAKNGDKITFPGFGTFEVKERAGRKGRNPQTGEEIDIAPSKSLHYKQGSHLKELIN
jgi:DNA-binding protein HU-beta